jgi:hypothetical protein
MRRTGRGVDEVKNRSEKYKRPDEEVDKIKNQSEKYEGLGRREGTNSCLKRKV